MAIETHVHQRLLTGLRFALNQVRPAAVLSGDWLLEHKTDFEVCGSSGACWKHGAGASNWPAMAAEAADEGRSMYDFMECYPETGEVYFGSGQAEDAGQELQLRAHLTHSYSGIHTYVCVLWVKQGDEMAVTKCAAGFSGHYDPSVFHWLGLVEKEKDLPPPREIAFRA